LAGLVPSDYSYRNLGHTVQQGVELSLDGESGEWNWFANASWQDDPDIRDPAVQAAEVNIPPEWRVNLGVGRDSGKRFWSAAVNYQSEAYWADVLFARAPTSSFTQVRCADPGAGRSRNHDPVGGDLRNVRTLDGPEE
jgi:hypothetical protein